MATSTTHPPATAEQHDLSAECALAQRDGYEGLHHACTQLADVPLPHGGGLILLRRCSCTCHTGAAS